MSLMYQGRDVCWHVFASALSKFPWTHLKPSFMRDRTSLEYAVPGPFI